MTTTDVPTSAGATRSARLAAEDVRRIVHPYTPTDSTERFIIESGSGCRVRDVDGREYLDGIGGLGLSQIGHGRREIAEAAAAQITRLEFFHSRWNFSNDRAIELASRLGEISPPGLDHVYFTSGGAEGNDIALRMARFFHYRNGEPDRTWFLGRNLGYHGITYGSGSVTGSAEYHDGFGPMLPNVKFLTAPYPYKREFFHGEDPTEFCLRELRETIEEIGPERIAAMIGEPIMGPGGVLIPPADYWPRVAELLKSYGILLISDEIVTGYGRLGKWFGAEHVGVTPDILVTAKGLTSGYVPHGAVLVSDRVAEMIGRDSGFPIGFTYNGHPTACAVALANLDIIEREGLLRNAEVVGDYLGDQLRALLDLPAVGEVRQLGLMIAVELVSDKETRKPLAAGTGPVADRIREESGVLVRGNPNSFVLTPPLVLTEAEADEAAEGVRSVLRRLRPDGTIQ
ncbi:aminotransferase class III-fold pyridoxal phosphate-dependent enzyme [Streptomyces sp. E-15]